MLFYVISLICYSNKSAKFNKNIIMFFIFNQIYILTMLYGKFYICFNSQRINVKVKEILIEKISLILK